MRKIYAAASVATLLGLNGGAIAADVNGGMKDPEVQITAPAIWSGFYLGANIGAGIGSHSLFNAQSTIGGDDIPDGGITLGSGDNSGVLGGGQLGYNFQAGRFVIGVEGEIMATGIEGHTPLQSFGASDDLNSDVDWVGAVTARLGTVVNGDTLLYVKGGIAWDQNDYKITATNPFETGAYPSVTDRRTGWLLGFGAEYSISPGWSAKMEYEFIDFGTDSVSFPQGGDDVDITRPFTTDVSQQLHVFKVGINRRFGYDRDDLR